jgi:hypothetical protein
MMDKNARHRVVKPEYLQISEAEAKALLKSGRARKSDQAASWKFTLFMVLATFGLIVSGTIAWYTWFDDPRVVPRLVVHPIDVADIPQELMAVVTAYNQTPSRAGIRAVFLAGGTDSLNAAFGLALMQQLIAQQALSEAKALAQPLEKAIGENLGQRLFFFWLKAHLAYEERRFEESKFYLNLLLSLPNAKEENLQLVNDAAAMLAEVEALLDRNLWPD